MGKGSGRDVGDKFPGGFPTLSTVEAAYDAADLIRAINLYKHFFPAVSGCALLDFQLEQRSRF